MNAPLTQNLPRWIELGAFIMAFVAGSINAIGLISFEHQSVSHLTGTTSILGANLASGQFTAAAHLCGILLSFGLGAGLSGLLLHSEELELGRHYDTALVIEALLIFLSFLLLSNGYYAGHYAASASCGIQNAMATRFSGAIIRTTHLTGIFTDLGLMLGAACRGESFDKRKALLFSIIISGFGLGSAFGAYGYSLLSLKALLIPGAISIALAIIYRIYYKRMKPLAS